MVDLSELKIRVSKITVTPIDDSRLRLAWMWCGDLIVEILETSPTEERAVFERVASLHLKVDCHFSQELMLYGNMAMMRLDMAGSTFTIIWDYIEGRHVIWDTAEPGFHASLIDNVVLQVTDRGFNAWPIASWNPLPSTLSVDFDNLQISALPSEHSTFTPFPYDFQPRTNATAFKSVNWYMKRVDPLVLDVFYCMGGITRQRTTGHRYEIEGYESKSPYIRVKRIATFTLPPRGSYPNLYHDSGSLISGFSSGALVRLQFGMMWSKTCIYSIIPVLEKAIRDEENPDTDLATAILTTVHDDDIRALLIW
ncbi:hypothetical protein EST38_g5655 [Candolleomyces aberdarensis]|uniref:Uncharacterized protein n=1 Tax=Candolleomyces aberdarensis TaxID=2316362 RepID=A0A4Q2DN59_9AGAR|nr:hypothetical protein EST38_g5655 [Candolleomyces aberdarensis]